MNKKNEGPTLIGDLLRLPAGVAQAAAAVSRTTGSGKESPQQARRGAD